jgi:D-alanine--poly(phosphoribitol) ligase subunit 2
MNDVKQALRTKIIELARGLGKDARQIKDDDLIPATGLLDSAGLMELVMWFEMENELSIEQDEITIENFGTIDAMANYLERRSGNAGVGA